MPERVEKCPLCAAGSNAQFDQRLFRGQQVVNVICNECGLVYQSPRMTEAESRVFYEAEYRLLYQGQEGPNTKDMSVQTNRAQAVLDFIRPMVKSADRILDIGCSTGILLHQFKEYYQCEAFGIEPGKVYREYAQSTGLMVFTSLDELAQDGQPAISLVSMMHVLEHLPDPTGYLARLRNGFMEADGWLLVEVPNLYAHDSFEVAHLVSFSTHTLQQVLGKAGFSVVALRTHGLPRSELIPLYITVLAQAHSSADFTLKPESNVRFKRRWGLFRRKLAERFSPQRAWLPAE